MLPKSRKSSSAQVLESLSSQPTSASAAQQFYKSLPKVGDAIDLTQFTKIAAGGTHDVYRFNDEEEPTFLLKVMTRTQGQSHEALQAQRQNLQTQYAKLYQTFGEHRCIIEDREVCKISGGGSEGHQETMVSIVAFDRCFQSEGKFGFNVSPVEDDEVMLGRHAQAYHRMNMQFMGAEELSGELNLDDFLLFEPNFKDIMERLDREEDLRKTMREFLEKYKAFYDETGILLDTIGWDNVLFYQDKDGWQFKLGSVIKHDTREHTLQTLAEFNIDPESIKESFEKQTPIFFVPPCVRALNAMAFKLGMNERVVADIILTQDDIANLAQAHKQTYAMTRASTFVKHQQFDKALEFYRKAISEEDGIGVNTRSRHMFGMAYWHYLENDNGQPNSPEEIDAYISMLSHNENTFDAEQLKNVEAAIQGLTAKREEIYPSNAKPSVYVKMQAN